MSVNGKRIGIAEEDILACASLADLRDQKARAILDEVKDAVRNWSRFAVEAKVPDEIAGAISCRLQQ